MAPEELLAPDPFPAAAAREEFQAACISTVALGHLAPYRHSWDDGSKYAGGFGVTELLFTDYWTLRARSVQLFEKNLYARGLIRRLVTNIINVGLTLECTPEESLLGFAEEGLADWTELVENRWELWANNPKLCDQNERLTFGQLQEQASIDAYVSGDILVTLAVDPRTGLPRLRLTRGEQVQTPLDAKPSGSNEIRHGVEIDTMGRHVAFWVTQKDGSSKRLPAFGEKSGRRLAWLVYGTDKRLDDVRGKPLLALALQSLQEIDRFRDATQRKAWLMANLAMWVEKGEAITGSHPFARAAVTGGHEVANPNPTNPTEPRRFRTAEQIPGAVIDELNQGEKVHAFQTNGTIETFADFEEAILCGIAWAHEIPPEILLLAFRSNYSASKAAINEFRMKLNKDRTWFGFSFNQPVYVEWLLAETLAGKLDAPKLPSGKAAPSLLDAWFDSSLYDVFASWISSDWSGQIKPDVDTPKLMAGYGLQLDFGAITYDRVARETTGMKFSKVVRRQKREVEALVAARAPLAELEALKKTPVSPEQPADDPSEADKPATGSSLRASERRAARRAAAPLRAI